VLDGKRRKPNRIAMHDWPRSDDEIIAHLLINTWSLTSGHVLRADVPPQELSAEELIDFWADDLMQELLDVTSRRNKDDGSQRL
jgi:hypothetical protein